MDAFSFEYTSENETDIQSPQKEYTVIDMPDDPEECPQIITIVKNKPDNEVQ